MTDAPESHRLNTLLASVVEEPSSTRSLSPIHHDSTSEDIGTDQEAVEDNVSLMLPLVSTQTDPLTDSPSGGTLQTSANSSSSSSGSRLQNFFVSWDASSWPPKLFQFRRNHKLWDWENQVTKEEEKPLCHRLRQCCSQTMVVMNVLARVTFWVSVVCMVGGVVWYSRELLINGTKPHLIAWFSAGAFVLMGFPISIYGILMHLTNYYQPNVQCYVVRILWMVPLYSIESWLCLRYRSYAIYIETLRDCYESYVLYCFFEYLIQVLGGEDDLVLMLKDKSPTRGVHMAPLHCCVRPWIMGQPKSRKTSYIQTAPAPNSTTTTATTTAAVSTASSSSGNNAENRDRGSGNVVSSISGGEVRQLGGGGSGTTSAAQPTKRPVVMVQWTSPFFVNCKLGVLQYVLLKFVSAICVMVLELQGLYKEGDFTPKGGYLYICILTNASQCWALYCLLFFYHATKNELSPVRPVGKFLCVKSLVFFTWWQGLGISILYEMDMIPHYAEQQWSSADVAKCIQDYLICIEMFLIAIAHTFVFPHTDYINPIVNAHRQHHDHVHSGHLMKRLGRKRRHHHHRGLGTSSSVASGLSLGTDSKSICSKSSEKDNIIDLELAATVNAAEHTPHVPPPGTNKSADKGRSPGRSLHSRASSTECDINAPSMLLFPSFRADGSNNTDGMESTMEMQQHDTEEQQQQHQETAAPAPQRQGFVRALLDSTLPLDVMDSTVGMVKGDFNVEKKTLLYHAATSDHYDLFSSRRRAKKNDKELA